jgi:hypothetical protein
MYSSFNSSAGDSSKDSTLRRSVNYVREQHQTNTTNTNASNSSTTSFCPPDKPLTSTYFDSKDTNNSSLNNPSLFPSFQSTLTSDARLRKGGLGFEVNHNLLTILF